MYHEAVGKAKVFPNRLNQGRRVFSFPGSPGNQRAPLLKLSSEEIDWQGAECSVAPHQQLILRREFIFTKVTRGRLM